MVGLEGGGCLWWVWVQIGWGEGSGVKRGIVLGVKRIQGSPSPSLWG